MGPRGPLLTIPGAIYGRLGGCSGSCVSIIFGPVGQPSPGSVLSPPSGAVRCTHVSWGVLAAPVRLIDVLVRLVRVARFIVVVLEVREPAAERVRARYT